MKRIGISIKPDDIQAIRLAKELYDWLGQRQRQVLLADCLAGSVAAPCMSLEDMSRKADLMVVLGGDGTVLHVARCFIGSGTPILGINLGRLGFLTQSPVADMFATLEQVLRGEVEIEERFSLKAETWRGGDRLREGYAINDVVLQRNEHPRMIELEMRVEGQFVFRLRSDGLVLATPTGSTAYALSAGGPIVHPEVDAISVVPICPHTLSNRPVVVPAKNEIELHVTESPAPAALNLDGQVHQELVLGDRVRVQKAGKVALAYLPARNYYDVLRTKLHWGGRAETADAD